jgi:hypothetical protein
MGFAGVIREGLFGRGRKVRAGTVRTALTAVGTSIALDTEKRFLPCLKILLDGYEKEDQPTTKKLPVEADIYRSSW